MFDTTGGDSVKRKLSPWCKEVKKTLIDRDMTVTDLCDQVGMRWLREKKRPVPSAMRNIMQ